MNGPTVIVVGGGIAGLAAAAAVLRAGWHVVVLERRPAFTEIGAGLAVTANGMAALDAVGAGPAVRAAGCRLFVAGTRDHRGRWLVRVPRTDDPGSLTWVCGMHRQRLHAALAAAASDAELVAGADVLAVEVGDAAAPARVSWRQDGEEHSAVADLVVAADGLRSVVRAQLFPGVRLGYSGMTCWRAAVTPETDPDDDFVIVWGPASEFGAIRTGEREVCWYGYVRHPADSPFPDEPAAARRLFAGWPAAVTDVIGATSPESLLRHDVYELAGSLPRYADGRVVVIGDAAHPMLPTMGQGANSSLEDAACVGGMIARPVRRGADLLATVEEFDRVRRPRTQAIVRRSRLTARFGAHVPGGLPKTLRDTAMRLMPAATTARAGARILRWSPP